MVVDLPRCGPMLSPCTESCTDSWHHWLGSLCGQAARRTSRSSCCATNSLCCADKSTDPSSPTPTGACSERLRPRSRDRAEPGGWSPPTRCCVSSGAASSDTGPNHSDRRADRRPQQSFADSNCTRLTRLVDICGGNGHGQTSGLRPCVCCLPALWVPIIRSWALTRGFALHSGTRNRYEIRYTRTQHRPASRHVNDHGRVSGTHRPLTGSTPRRRTISSSFSSTSRACSRASHICRRATRRQTAPSSRSVTSARL